MPEAAGCGRRQRGEDVGANPHRDMRRRLGTAPFAGRWDHQPALRQLDVGDPHAGDLAEPRARAREHEHEPAEAAVPARLLVDLPCCGDELPDVGRPACASREGGRGPAREPASPSLVASRRVGGSWSRWRLAAMLSAALKSCTRRAGARSSRPASHAASWLVVRAASGVDAPSESTRSASLLRAFPFAPAPPCCSQRCSRCSQGALRNWNPRMLNPCSIYGCRFLRTMAHGKGHDLRNQRVDWTRPHFIIAMPSKRIDFGSAGSAVHRRGVVNSSRP
jgi:hypothetical protein